jgi:hypothetical protein
MTDAAPGPHQRFLHRVLGVVQRAEHPVAVGQQLVPVRRDQPVERAGVAAAGGGGEIGGRGHGPIVPGAGCAAMNSGHARDSTGTEHRGEESAMTDEQQIRDLIERWAVAVHDGDLVRGHDQLTGCFGRRGPLTQVGLVLVVQDRGEFGEGGRDGQGRFDPGRSELLPGVLATGKSGAEEAEGFTLMLAGTEHI